MYFLSAFQEDSANKGNVLGEVVICLPYAEKQARELGISFRENLATLTAHGVIHLCGIDHEKSDEEYKRTFRDPTESFERFKL